MVVDVEAARAILGDFGRNCSKLVTLLSMVRRDWSRIYFFHMARFEINVDNAVICST